MDAGRRTGSAQRSDMANLGERESKPAGLPHEGQERQHVGRIATITGSSPTRRGKDAARLVQPNRLPADAASLRHLPDEQPVFHGGSIGLAPWGNVKPLCEARGLPEWPDVDGLDPDSKLISSWTVGLRDALTGHAFMLDLASRFANNVQLTTGGHFAWSHRTLRVTPAVEAEVPDHVWSFDEIARVAA